MIGLQTIQEAPNAFNINQAKLRALLRPGVRPPALGDASSHVTHCNKTDILSCPSWVPSSAATAADISHQTSDDLNLDDLPSDLDIAITHLTAAYSAWLPSIGAPPLLLKTHIYSILKDRTQTDRDLEDLRRSRVIVMFKLSTGMDEHAILRTSDYASILHRAADAETSANAIRSNDDSRPHINPPSLSSNSSSPQAPYTVDTSTNVSSQHKPAIFPGRSSSHARLLATSEHMVAVERFLANVVLQGQCRCDVSIPHSELLQLLALPPRPVTSTAAPGTGSKRNYTEIQATASAIRPPAFPSQQQQQQQQRRSSGEFRSATSVSDFGGAPFASPSPGQAARLVAVSAAAGVTATAAREAKALAATPSADRCLSLLLNMGALARHTSQDATYMLSVPGAGAVIKGIAAGRQELLGFLRKKKYGEIPEALLRSSGKLKHSVLSIDLHLRDLLGRGAVSRVATTVGPLIKLTSIGLAQGTKFQHR